MKHHKELKPQVYVVPEDLDREIARLKLESMGHQSRQADRRAGTLSCLLAGRHVSSEALLPERVIFNWGVSKHRGAFLVNFFGTWIASCGIYCGHALEVARLRGATYADVRVMHLRQRDLTTKNGQVGTLAQSESIGTGHSRGGQWRVGICLDRPLTREGVAACAAQAVAIAKASALAKRGRCRLAPRKRLHR